VGCANERLDRKFTEDPGQRGGGEARVLRGGVVNRECSVCGQLDATALASRQPPLLDLDAGVTVAATARGASRRDSRRRRMSARDSVYILSLHEKGDSWRSKNTIYNSGMLYKSRYDVPRKRMFSNRPAEYDKFSPLTSTSFAGVTLADKLLVMGHGNMTRIAHIPADDLARDLRAWGLRAVGVVTFKACQLGSGWFLSQFVTHCRLQGIDIGWAKGYTGNVRTELKHTLYGKPTEVNRNPIGPHKAHRLVVVRGSHADTVPAPSAKDAVEIDPDD
jgi:hypothetical protein